MIIQVKEAKIKQKPSFLAKTVKTLKYGDEIEIRRTSGAWHQLTDGHWVHDSAITARGSFHPTGTPAPENVSDKELVLAGKGFDQATEQSYRKAHPGLPFDKVNYLESFGVEDAHLAKFIAIGQLGGNP